MWVTDTAGYVRAVYLEAPIRDGALPAGDRPNFSMVKVRTAGDRYVFPVFLNIG